MDYRSQLQSSLGSTYTLERELGGGGMSRVFLAEERALGRKVVVKVLPPDVLAGVNAERFHREIQLAARLQQAQIVPVLSAGEVNGIQYYTMPFVEGESLRSRLTRDGALPIPEMVNVLRDVTRALAYAHERGVVHRDIKPDNVLLSGGTAVVTDFGIAKAISAARVASTDTALTQMGTSVGTPAYMSPEQAAGDPDVDYRADIYSLGCMAYELLTGKPPFAGRTPQRTLAAHLSEAPVPVSSLRTDVPPSLAALVMRCLEKDPALRPQSASEIAAQLDAVTSSGTLPAFVSGISTPGVIRRALLLYAAAFLVVALVAKALVVAIGLPDWVFNGAVILAAACLPLMLATAYSHHIARRDAGASVTGNPQTRSGVGTLARKATPHLTWRRSFRIAAGAVGGFAAVVVIVMVLRLFGIGPVASLLAAGTLRGRERLLVADFAAGKDTSLSHLMTEAVRTDLGQSPVVSIMPPSAVGAALTRMQRPAATMVDIPLAREIAQREGVKAIVAGSLTPLGTGYAVSVRLIAADSGSDLAAFRKSVDAPSQLLDAIDDLTKKLRGRIGESLKSVREAPPLDQVTTSSLEALRKYAEGSRAFDLEGDYTKAASLLRESVARDTMFAMAYRKLGIALSNGGMPHAQVDSALTKAFKYSARLPEKERFLAIGSYYQNGPERNRRKAGEAFEHVLSIDSTEPAALNNLANIYRSLRQFARAESLYRIQTASPRAAQVSFSNFLGTLMVQGKVAQAESAFAVWQRRFPPSATALAYPALLMYARGQRDSAERYWRTVPTDKIPAVRINALANLAQFSLLHGRLRASDSLYGAVRALQSTMGQPPNVLSDSVTFAQQLLWYEQDSNRAVRVLDATLARVPLKTLPEERRPYFTIASLYAMAGRIDKARAMIAQFDAEVKDSTTRMLESPGRHWAFGEIALAEKRPLEAVREFWKSDSLPDGPDGDCYFCKEVLVARAFDAANQPDSAIVHFERFLAGHFPSRLALDDQYLAPAEQRLAELYEAKGDSQRAASHYLAFIDLWKNADPLLQPRVQEAKRRLARMSEIAGK
jgi:eukaryotic-like serine/threonine-protein kinase